MNFNLDIVSATALEEHNFEDGFLSKCTFGGFEGEESNVRFAVECAKERRANLHVLTDEKTGTLCGFAALRLSALYGDACVILDLLFTAAVLRKRPFEDLNNSTIADYLINHSIETAFAISESIPIKYVALTIVDDKLIKFYGRHGFRFLPDDYWMALKIV